MSMDWRHRNLEVGEYYQRTSFFDWAYSMYDPFIKEDGTIKNYRAGENNLDMINPGRNLFFLHEKTGEQRFIKAAHVLRGQLINQPRTRSGIYWHKQIYPWQVWLDGVYMQGPFSALYAKHVDQRSIIEDLVAQIEGVCNASGFRNRVALPCMGRVARMRWSDIETGLSPHFWGRALGGMRWRSLTSSRSYQPIIRFPIR